MCTHGSGCSPGVGTLSEVDTQGCGCSGERTLSESGCSHGVDAYGSGALRSGHSGKWVLSRVAAYGMDALWSGCSGERALRGVGVPGRECAFGIQSSGKCALRVVGSPRNGQSLGVLVSGFSRDLARIGLNTLR